MQLPLDALFSFIHWQRVHHILNVNCCPCAIETMLLGEKWAITSLSFKTVKKQKQT